MPKAQYKELLATCLSNLQKGFSSHQSEWLASKNPQTINVGEGVERREPSNIVGKNINWYSHCGEQYGGSIKN